MVRPGERQEEQGRDVAVEIPRVQVKAAVRLVVDFGLDQVRKHAAQFHATGRRGRRH